MTVSRLALASPADDSAGRLSDEVELYQRTYNTLLRSSGETHLRVLDSSHRQMGSSLHPLADSDEPDLGAVELQARREDLLPEELELRRRRRGGRGQKQDEDGERGSEHGGLPRARKPRA